MNDFSLRELECFLAVAQELSFTRAAERLRLAQPPLSRHVRVLEEKLGVALFQRTKRSVRLTLAGAAFQEEAGDILLRLRQAAEAARRAGEGEIARLDVGFVGAVLSPELVALLTRFRKASPELRLHLHDQLPADQVAAVLSGDLDIGFVGVCPDPLPSGLAAEAWMDEPLFVFLPPEHRFADSESVRLQDLAEDPFVSIAAEAAPSFTALILQECEAAGFQPRIVQEARRAQAVAAMTVVGSGVTILPASLNRITGNGVPLRFSRNRRARITHTSLFRAADSDRFAGLWKKREPA
ncbi:MAG: LysR substrate-binding domain-containing protein [Verrucomicrobiota bacterium]